jgi:branched-chain amino acid transport system substrate-binding protein
VKALALALVLVGPVILRDSGQPGPEGSAVILRDAGQAGPEGSATADPSPRGRTDAAQDDEPYKKASPEPLEFRGPGRERPEPDVDEVVLGWFGPGDPGHPDFGDDWRGAVLALEQENAAGGYHGKPFRIEPAWSESPWKAGVVGVARLVNEGGAWAVIGGVDGTTTHLAVQLALKSNFLLLSPGSTDVTADDANVPWLFSLSPSDEPVSVAMADAVSEATSGGPFVVAASTDHDAHSALVWVRRALASKRLAPASVVEFATVEPDFAGLADRVLRERPRVLVVLAPATVAGRFVAAVREAGWTGTIVGGATVGRAAFARAAGAAADGVVAWVPADARAGGEAFAAAFQSRWGEPPDQAACHGYDAVRLVAAAVRQTGLNRARMRDAIRELSPWAGSCGRVRWNARGRNDDRVRPARWAAGRLVPVD